MDAPLGGLLPHRAEKPGCYFYTPDTPTGFGSKFKLKLQMSFSWNQNGMFFINDIARLQFFLTPILICTTWSIDSSPEGGTSHVNMLIIQLDHASWLSSFVHLHMYIHHFQYLLFKGPKRSQNVFIVYHIETFSRCLW